MWGDDSYGEVTVPADLGTVRAITAGSIHTCAIKTDGTPRCWGDNDYGQGRVPTAVKKVKAIAARQFYNCAILLDDTARCWGDDSYGRAEVPADLGTVTAIAPGGYHACAIRTDGSPRCWGLDSERQSTIPAGLGTVSALAANGHQTCAIRTATGRAACWGYSLGSLGRAPEVPAPGSAGPARGRAGSAAQVHVAPRHARRGVHLGRDLPPGLSLTPDGTLSGVAPPAGGDFEYTVTADNGVFPSASRTFRMLAGSRPLPTSPPAIEGTLLAGETLTARLGTWSGQPAPTVAQQWQRCGQHGRGCRDIPGATGLTYALTGEDVRRTLRIVVTASNAFGTHSEASPVTHVVAMPRRITRPVITGTLTVGRTVTADPGTWPGSPSFAYRWQRCAAATTDCSDIAGAQSSSYVLVPADAGQRMRVVVTATYPFGTSLARSQRTRAVAGA